jgi:hypothetical protein
MRPALRAVVSAGAARIIPGSLEDAEHLCITAAVPGRALRPDHEPGEATVCPWHTRALS